MSKTREINKIELFPIQCQKYNLGLHWFCFATCMLCDWPRKLAPPSQSNYDTKLKTNLDLVTHIFKLLRPVMFIYFEFSLAACDVNLCSD